MRLHAGILCLKNKSKRIVCEILVNDGRKNLSGPISRVLFFWVNFPKAAIISLRRQLPVTSSSPPEEIPRRIAPGRCFQQTLFCSALLSMGFTKPSQSPGLLVSSYLTFSPLPADRSLLAVCFLRHFPEPRGWWALPTIVSCRARTFLPPDMVLAQKMPFHRKRRICIFQNPKINLASDCLAHSNSR